MSTDHASAGCAERARLWESSVIGASGRGAFRHKSGAGSRMGAHLAAPTAPSLCPHVDKPMDHDRRPVVPSRMHRAAIPQPRRQSASVKHVSWGVGRRRSDRHRRGRSCSGRATTARTRGPTCCERANSIDLLGTRPPNRAAVPPRASVASTVIARFRGLRRRGRAEASTGRAYGGQKAFVTAPLDAW
jgi:hypothetical protein